MLRTMVVKTSKINPLTFMKLKFLVISIKGNVGCSSIFFG